MMGYDYHGPGGLFTRTDYNCPLPAMVSINVKKKKKNTLARARVAQ